MTVTPTSRGDYYLSTVDRQCPTVHAQIKVGSQERQRRYPDQQLRDLVAEA